MLSWEEQVEIARQVKEKRNDWNEFKKKTIEEELQRVGIDSAEQTRGDPIHFDHPDSMTNGQATAWYILIMAIGLIFNARWIIWIVASIIYFRFITRHNR